jgi:ATP-dependent helicase YprA (DUF1998 family)
LSYVVPIIDDILHNPEIKGVRAILVYPINALINSQKKAFADFLKQVSNSPIRVKQYTGQESLEGGNAEFGQNSTLRLKTASCMACKEPSRT